MSENQKQAPLIFKKNALDEKRLALYGNKREGAKGPPKLTVSLTVNNPRFTVFTNDNKNTILRAKMDAPTFFAVILEILELPDREPGFTRTWVNMTGAPSNMVEDTRTTVGKNNKGVCFITVYKDNGEDRIIFAFTPSMYHKVFDANGEVPIDQLSARYAQAWGRMLIEVVPNVMDTHFMETTPYQQNRSGGGGYNANKGGNNNSNNNSTPPPSGGSSSNDSGFDDFDGLPM